MAQFPSYAHWTPKTVTATAPIGTYIHPHAHSTCKTYVHIYICLPILLCMTAQLWLSLPTVQYTFMHSMLHHITVQHSQQAHGPSRTYSPPYHQEKKIQTKLGVFWCHVTWALEWNYFYSFLFRVNYLDLFLPFLYHLRCFLAATKRGLRQGLVTIPNFVMPLCFLTPMVF